MLTRRTLLASALSAAAAAPALVLPGLVLPARAAPAASPPTLAEDGLYHYDWYLESFLDLAEDIAGAAQKGRRLAVVWGQKGCIYCKRMALEHLADPAISGYIQANFDVLHLNLFGARETTDLDGRKMPEKQLAQTYGIRLTPTVQFFPESAEGLGARAAPKREVARMPGLLEPREFLAMFRFVREKGYEKASFSDWLRKGA